MLIKTLTVAIIPGELSETKTTVNHISPLVQYFFLGFVLGFLFKTTCKCQVVVTTNSFVSTALFHQYLRTHTPTAIAVASF